MGQTFHSRPMKLVRWHAESSYSLLGGHMRVRVRVWVWEGGQPHDGGTPVRVSGQ